MASLPTAPHRPLWEVCHRQPTHTALTQHSSYFRSPSHASHT